MSQVLTCLGMTTTWIPPIIHFGEAYLTDMAHRMVYLINGKFPPKPLILDQGDDVEVRRSHSTLYLDRWRVTHPFTFRRSS